MCCVGFGVIIFFTTMEGQQRMYLLNVAFFLLALLAGFSEQQQPVADLAIVFPGPDNPGSVLVDQSTRALLIGVDKIYIYGSVDTMPSGSNPAPVKVLGAPNFTTTLGGPSQDWIGFSVPGLALRMLCSYCVVSVVLRCCVLCCVELSCVCIVLCCGAVWLH